MGIENGMQIEHICIPRCPHFANTDADTDTEKSRGRKQWVEQAMIAE